MKNPIYLFWVILTVGSLAFANLRGWSLIYSLSPARIFGFRPTPGFNHK